MRVLFLDCFSGISGDMTVGALCDLGVKPSTFEWELSKLEIGDFHMHFERGRRQSVDGVKFGIHEGATHTHEQDEEHDHEHHHHHHEHAHEHEQEHHHHEHEHEHGRSYAEIRALIEASDLSDFVKKHALSIFHRVAVAEAKVHGKSVETIGFHEVGALDSIADIVLACVGIEELGVEKIYFGPLADGRGWVECAHGRFPIPAMATLEILQGIPVGQIDEPFEFITPTGAAIAAEFSAGFGPMPSLRVEKIGYGLGSRDLKSRPNVLRAVVGELVEAEPAGSYATDTVTQIETNIDDLSPEITGALMDRLLAAGALDVFFTPIQMKKNRPGVLLTVLCETGAVERAAGVIFKETSSFGLRLTEKRRLKLERRIESVKTPHGDVEVKLGFDAAGKLLQVAPEYESCRAAGDRAGVALREVYQSAIQAYTGTKLAF